MTLEDVATLAQVTKITVSRYLREPGLVAEATAARVRAALQETGYVPNKQAGLLASGRSAVVAALIPNLSHSIFGDTVQALSERLQGAGLELLLASTGYSPQREEDQLRAVLGWAPAAIIVTGRHHAPAARRLLQGVHSSGTPVIEIWDFRRSTGEGALTQIGFDHAQVGRSMAQHLLQTGHRKLAYVHSGVTDDFRAHERGRAFVAAGRRAGATIQELTADVGDRFDAGRRALMALASGRGLSASAVACANDHLACGLMLQAQAGGHEVPRDLAVLGFGDFPVGRQLQPALSTVRPPSREIGQAAAQAVIDALGEGAQAPSSQSLAWELLVRGSSGTGQ